MEKWLSLWSIGQSKTKNDMEAIKNAGFEGVEIWAEHKSAKEDLKLAEQCGLKIGLHLPFHDLNLATPYEEVGSFILDITHHWLKELGKYGGGHAVIHGGSAWASENKDEDRLKVIERLKKIREMAYEQKVELLFENQIPDKLNYMHIYPSSVEEWLDILIETDTTACLDTGHLAVLGASLDETVKTLGSRLASVHFSDNDTKGDLHQLPGDGTSRVGTADLLEILRKYNYEGPVVFEINPYTYSLSEILEHSSVKVEIE